MRPSSPHQSRTCITSPNCTKMSRSSTHRKTKLFIIILCSFMCLTLADNFTTFHKNQAKSYETRQHRLLTFNSKPDDDINVELDFAVPFIRIPVKSGMSDGVLANLNIGAVALAGMMAFGAAFVIPATFQLFNMKKPYKNPPEGGYRQRSDDMFPTSSALWGFMANIDKLLTEHNIDSTSCVQRAICWTVKDSNKRLAVGKASSTDKIVDGLATHSWIGQLVAGSVFQAAIQSGLRGENCASEYKQCLIDQESIQRFSMQLINAVHDQK